MFYEWLMSLNEADESSWPNMLNAINPSSLRQFGRHHKDDHTARLVAADYLDELGRHEEAALLRDQSKHVYRNDGKIHNAHEISRQMGFLRSRDRGYYNGLSPEQIRYLEAALFAESDENGDPLSVNYNINDFAPRTVTAMATDWESFKDHAVSLGILGNDVPERTPGDFFLSRNHSGAGFFAYPEIYGKEQAKALQELAKRYGEYNLMIGDDALIHGYSYHVNPTPKPDRKRKK
jgi:uncharacterized protein (TIGR02996 family)